MTLLVKESISVEPEFVKSEQEVVVVRNGNDHRRKDLKG